MLIQAIQITEECMNNKRVYLSPTVREEAHFQMCESSVMTELVKLDNTLFVLGYIHR